MSGSLKTIGPYKLLGLPRRAQLLTLLVGIGLLTACGSDPLVPDDPGRAGDGTLAEALEFVRNAHGLPALAGMMVHQGLVVEMAAVGTRAAGGPEAVTVDATPVE